MRSSDHAKPAVSPSEQVRAYHQRSKHSFERYAAGPAFMDWATQPDPFRRYLGAQQIPLALAADEQVVPFADLFEPHRVPIQPLMIKTLSALLELSFGLSAWKAYGGERWALRCNPSSGNLHPTESYVVAGFGIEGLNPGVYHYQSHDHALEERCLADFPFTGVLIGLSSIHWREAWKYGERAFRYCQHDIGHALGALRYAAAVLGWQVRLLDEFGDLEISRLLGLDRDADFGSAECEAPDLMCRVGPDVDEPVAIDLIVKTAGDGSWRGRANVLSARHSHNWPAIDEVFAATFKPRTEPAPPMGFDFPPLTPTRCRLRAADLIRQRRSAQAFDGLTAIGANALWRMLDATLPRRELPPFDCWPWPPRVHLILFIHRVEGLAPGLYLFLRQSEVEAELRRVTHAEFAWRKPDDCPPHLKLFQLVAANCQRAASTVSCHQDIAGDSAFSLGMLAEFDRTLAEGAANYRRLYWECGLIGQVLYLEAEAARVRGTGIGCFFDDAVHELLGLADTRFQSLYHFTVGGPLTDGRLKTLPPYGHLRRSRPLP